MRCPICGQETSSDAASCAHCGTNFQILQESLHGKLHSATETLPTDQVNNKRTKSRFPVSVRVICAATAFLLAAAAILLWPDSPPSVELPPNTSSSATGSPTTLSTRPTTSPTTSPTTAPPTTDPTPPDPVRYVGKYLSSQHSIEIGTDLEATTVLFDESHVEKILASALTYSQPSLDGSVRALLTADNTLYVAKDGALTLVDTNVGTDFKLSAMGNSILYCQQTPGGKEKLCVYSVDEKQKLVISNDYDKILDSCISPNGRNIAFRYAGNSENLPELFCFFDWSACFSLGYCDESLISISDSGELIYALQTNQNNLWCYNIDGGKELIGYSIRTPVYLNMDHSQILFHSEKRSFLSVAGKNAAIFAEYYAVPLLPLDSASFYSGYSTTIPFESFYGHIYERYADSSLLYIDSYQYYWIASDIQNTKLAPGGRYVFFQQSGRPGYFDLAGDLVHYIATAADPYRLQVSPTAIDGYPPDSIFFAYTVGGVLYYGALTSMGLEVESADCSPDSYCFGRKGLYYMNDSAVFIERAEGHQKLPLEFGSVYSTSSGHVRFITRNYCYYLQNGSFIPYGSAVNYWDEELD